MKLNINDVAALAIKNNTKRVEVRVGKESAERNAIANMITNGESEIIKLVCIDSKGNVGLPCGACREYLMQLSKSSKNIEILKDIDSKEIVKLDELIPGWWGYDRV